LIDAGTKGLAIRSELVHSIEDCFDCFKEGMAVESEADIALISDDSDVAGIDVGFLISLDDGCIDGDTNVYTEGSDIGMLFGSTEVCVGGFKERIDLGAEAFLFLGSILERCFT